MFKVTISAKSMFELRSKVVEYLSGMDDFTVRSGPSQAEESPEAIAFGSPEPIWKEPKAFVPPPVAPPAEVETPAPIKAYQDKVGTLLEFGVDSKGLPWDARIHSVSQGTNKDGSWRLRRGVEDDTVKQVEIELREKMASEGQPVAEPAPVAHTLPPIPPPVPAPAPFLAAAPVVQVVVTPPAPSAPVSIAPVLNAHSAKTFKENLVATLGRLVSEKKLTQDYVNQLKQYFQVEQIWQVTEAQAAEMFETFVANGLIAKAE